jgi:hypothetical protein
VAELFVDQQLFAMRSVYFVSRRVSFVIDH